MEVVCRSVYYVLEIELKQFSHCVPSEAQKQDAALEE